MFKYVVCLALLASVYGAPEASPEAKPEANPGLVAAAYTAPLVSAPLVSAPVVSARYAAYPSLASPLAYSAGYVAPSVYSAYSAPYVVV